MCVCVCRFMRESVCIIVRERERDSEKEPKTNLQIERIKAFPGVRAHVGMCDYSSKNRMVGKYGHKSVREILQETKRKRK